MGLPGAGLAALCRGEAEHRLFADDWHGISLESVARETGLPLESIANEHFYEALYRRWKARSFASDEGWVRAKRQIARLMNDNLHRYAPRGARILSVGAGLGLIESDLLDQGWRVELQECQAESLDRFAGDPRTRVWIGPDLSGLPSDAFDAVLSISMVYALSLTRYRAFLSNCARILKPGGVLIVWDHDVRIRLAALRRRLGGRRSLFWGWLRTPRLHRALAEAAGFRTERVRFIDRDCVAIASPWRIAGLQGPFGRSLAQELTFVRTTANGAA
jgi:SAM-dependent methyltransferase